MGDRLGPTVLWMISVQWACQVTANSNYTLNGDQFYAMATGLVWQYILECWQQCNQALHNPRRYPQKLMFLLHKYTKYSRQPEDTPSLNTSYPPSPLSLFYSDQSKNYSNGYNAATNNSTTASPPLNSMLHYTRLTSEPSSVPCKPMTCDHHNWPKLSKYVGLLDYYGSP